jgi:hypothetical protein
MVFELAFGAGNVGFHRSWADGYADTNDIL